MFANNALLGGGVRVRVGIREQIKDTTKLLMAILTSHCEAARARLERITLISIVVYVVEQSSISIEIL